MPKQNIILFLLDKLWDRSQSKTETDVKTKVKVDIRQKISVIVVNITNNDRN